MWKTSINVSHCSISKERINCVKEWIWSVCVFVDCDWSEESDDCWRGPSERNREKMFLLHLQSIDIRKTGNWSSSKKSSTFLSFERKTKETSNRSSTFPKRFTLIKNERWKIFSTDREKSFGWIVKRKKPTGRSSTSPNRWEERISMDESYFHFGQTHFPKIEEFE